MKLLPVLFSLLLFANACTTKPAVEAKVLHKNVIALRLTPGLIVPTLNNSILGQWYVEDHIYLLNANLNADELIAKRHNLNLCINSPVIINNNGIGPDNKWCELSGYTFNPSKCTARKLPLYEGTDYSLKHMGSEVADSNYMSVQLAWRIIPIYKGWNMTVLNTNCHFEGTKEILRICVADSNTIALLTYADLLILKRNKPQQRVLPDTAIAKTIGLGNYQLIEAAFSDLMPYVDRDADLPYVYLSNKTETQFAKLIFHPGGIKNSFYEFEVGTTRPTTFRKTNIAGFVTNNGVQLGMGLSKFNQLKKQALTKSTQGNKTIFTLRLEWPSIFILSYNMPIYYANYVFENQVLTSYSFGFEYP